MSDAKKFIEVRKKKAADCLKTLTPEERRSKNPFPYHQEFEEEITLTTSKKLVSELQARSAASFEDKIMAYTEGNLEQTPYWYGDSYKTLIRYKTRIKIKTLEELTSTLNLLERWKTRNTNWSGHSRQAQQACERMFKELQKEAEKRDLQ